MLRKSGQCFFDLGLKTFILVVLFSEYPTLAVGLESLPTESISGPAIISEEKETTLSASISGRGIKLDTSAGFVLGSELSGSAGVAITQKIQVSLGISQALSITSGFGLIYNSVEVETSYAITGGFRGKDTKYTLGGSEVAFIHDSYPGGWRASGNVSQLFLNGSRNVISMKGPGMGVAYEWPSFTNRNPGVDGKIDFMSSGQISIVVWRISFNYSIRY